ncbi:DNA polymerase iota [Tachysurus vachellii]|uniref:DNA polymerase iota n=1 Tax=Tachysurus vachellii TaxID=175792 RepID=UPI00296AD0DA|nr:DNA polymerase iota [Tachysurus vachellii]
MDQEEEEDSEWTTLDTGFPVGSVKDKPRVILHFDMDCFYAQVEMIRNPGLRSKPVGVQQKYLMVTCNYIAREQGVSKMMSVKEALEKCPDLVLVSGEDLNFYRETSYKVTELLMSYCPLVERLGLDENFVDVTELVESRRRNTDISELSFVGHIYKHDVSSVAIQDHVSLALGSVIACELREVLFSRLSLTSCAGVANNKLLAKLVSGTFKPNQQTTLLPQSVSQLMSSLNGASGVPGIGYRTAERLKALSVFSVRDLQLFPLRQLICEFGEANAKRIQSLACGIDLSPVTPAGPPQSLSDEDSFKKISTLSEAESKITELLLSLSERMHKDGRLPQTLKLTLRRSSAPSRWFNRESRQSPIPTHTAHRIINGCSEAVPQLVSIAMKLLHKLVDVREPFHLTLLNVCFTNLQTKPSNRNTISSFFTSTHTSTHTPTHTLTHTSTHSLCDAPYSFTQPEALCETMTRKNNKETSSSSSLFFQQTIKATSSVTPVLECSDPNKSTVDSIKSVIVPELPPDVDPDVFRALPWHIQSELMSSFQEDSVERQEHPISSALPTAHTDDLITQPSSGTEEPGDVSAEERVPADPDVPDVPPNVDPYVFSQLPPDMQRELRTEWRQSKLTLKMSQKHTARRTTTAREKRPVVKRSNSGSLLQYFKPSSDKRF